MSEVGGHIDFAGAARGTATRAARRAAAAAGGATATRLTAAPVFFFLDARRNRSVFEEHQPLVPLGKRFDQRREVRIRGAEKMDDRLTSLQQHLDIDNLGAQFQLMDKRDTIVEKPLA